MPKLKTLYIMQIFLLVEGGGGGGRRGLAFLKQCLLLKFSVGFIMLYHCQDSSM